MNTKSKTKGVAWSVLFMLVFATGVYALETNCGNNLDDDSDGKIDCRDTDCDGHWNSYYGHYCCQSDSVCTGIQCAQGTCTKTGCGEEECYYCPWRPLSEQFVCNANYKCSDSSRGNNDYDVSDFKAPSQGVCDNEGNCDAAQSSAQLCTYAEGSGEGTSITSICVDGVSTCQNSCADGVDNDGDGYTDSNDTGCMYCGDGICNNGETYATCPADCEPQTDLVITDLIPLQVVPGVDMVVGKTGYVRVRVLNNGSNAANGMVNVTLGGTQLYAKTLPSNTTLMYPIAPGQTVNFDFKFLRNTAGVAEFKAGVITS